MKRFSYLTLSESVSPLTLVWGYCGMRRSGSMWMFDHKSDKDDQDLVIDCDSTNSCSSSSIIGIFSSSTQDTVSIRSSMQQPSSQLTVAIGRVTLTINQSVRRVETSASIAGNRLQLMFEQIVQKYLLPGVAMELNISSKERRLIQDQRLSQGTPEPSMFRKLRDDVLVSLYQSSWRTFWTLQNTKFQN